MDICNAIIPDFFVFLIHSFTFFYPRLHRCRFVYLFLALFKVIYARLEYNIKLPLTLIIKQVVTGDKHIHGIYYPLEKVNLCYLLTLPEKTMTFICCFFFYLLDILSCFNLFTVCPSLPFQTFFCIFFWVKEYFNIDIEEEMEQAGL